MQVTGSKHTYYNLSIRIKADGFSFFVTEGISGDNLLCNDFTVAEGESLADLLSEKLLSDDIRRFGFSRVRVISYTDATCIPQQEFMAEDLTQLYHVVFPSFDEQQYDVVYTHLPQLDIVEAFLVRKDIQKAVMAIYPDATFTNASTVVLGRIATFYKRQQLPDNALFAYATPLQLFLYSIREDKLQFSNSFPLDQPQDSLYYLLSVWKMLQLNVRKHHCYVAGEEGSVEFLAEALKPYLQYVDVMTVSVES